ncbi:PPC domain-containing DNA-binding protein [Desulfospira joergensenii]|uniref:PPC domain-containing DNA-binding protein n=1 Tax=Desulfospira joergensenii TaxID=53329 RepID=UPI0003B5B23B|nr:PPC domain-containing DNA-binding protein [Desulfospira joergensenii]
MRYSQARPGRVFVLRLEQGETVHETIETFVREKGIQTASVIALGGADRESVLVAGPEKGDQRPIITQLQVLDDVHEIMGTGTIFPDEEGSPILHMHMACGRGPDVRVGCIRNGVKVWLYMEVVIQELVDSSGIRKMDQDSGFKLLEP